MYGSFQSSCFAVHYSFLEICVIWSIFPGRIYRNESGQKFLSSNARLLKEAQSSDKDICWVDIDGQ